MQIKTPHPHARKNRSTSSAPERAPTAVSDALFEKISERLDQLAQAGARADDERTAERAAQRVLEAHDERLQHLLAVQERLQAELGRLNERLSANQDLLARLLRTQGDSDAVAAPSYPSEAEDVSAQKPARPGPRNQADPDGGWTALLRQGEALRVGWVRDGWLVSTAELAKTWGRSRQALDQACDRGKLFSLKVGKNKYYPRVFLQLDADAVKQVCLALKGDDSTGKFVFWRRKHGALGAKTVAEAIREGKLARIVELALGWSEEHGKSNASAA